MKSRDELGSRMKEYYENIPKTRLMRRTPVAIRIDGKAFHTFTRGFKRPFDEILVKAMQDTTEYLCKNIQGCVFGYTQSDEITLILIDYQTFTSGAWFDYEVQKMCSIAASMATMEFNRRFSSMVKQYNNKVDDMRVMKILTDEDIKMLIAYENALDRGAMFDARCFNIPKEEVTNLVYWRQVDASRNSVEMVGRAYFSHKQLHKKSCSNIQDMLHEQFGVNWNNFPTYLKRGSACIKDSDGSWKIDLDMPLLKGEGRKYLDDLIYIGA